MTLRSLHVHAALLGLLVGAPVILLDPGSAEAAVKVLTDITPDEAKDHVQRTKTVCGVVASSRYADATTTKLTYLNLGRPYPDQPFTAVIPPALRPKFKERPEELFKGKTICVTGPISLYREKPQIVIADPSQITIVDTASSTNTPPADGTSPGHP